MSDLKAQRSRPILPHLHAGSETTVGFLVVAVALTVGWAVLQPSLARVAIAAAVSVLFVAIAPMSVSLLITGLIGWVAALGLLRRLAHSVGGASPLGDPLLLVEAAALGAALVVAAGRRAFRDRTPLASAVLLLQVLLLLSAVNPLQGSPTVGLGGLLIVLVPGAGFWIGRTYLDDHATRRIFMSVAWCAMAGASYGLYQTYVHFPTWDERWIVEQGYPALQVGGFVRAFSSFVATSDYLLFAAMGAVVWLVMGRSYSRAASVLALPMLAVALWTSGARGPVVGVVLAALAVVVARAGWSLPTALVMGALILLVAPFVVGRLAPTTYSSTVAGAGAARQVSGLAEPFGEDSSLQGHLRQTRDGVAAVLHNPAGRGVGSITTAAGKYGQAAIGTENDLSGAAIAAGLPGLIAYWLVVVRVYRTAWGTARKRRDAVALATLGVLVVSPFSWLIGGNYASALVLWLTIGRVDAASRPDREVALAAA